MELSTAMVADAAHVAGGKMYILGGQWDRLTVANFPAQHPAMAVVLVLKIEYTEALTDHRLTVELTLDGAPQDVTAMHSDRRRIRCRACPATHSDSLAAHAARGGGAADRCRTQNGSPGSLHLAPLRVMAWQRPASAAGGWGAIVPPGRRRSRGSFMSALRLDGHGGLAAGEHELPPPGG
jgi:hypothetical protein